MEKHKFEHARVESTVLYNLANRVAFPAYFKTQGGVSYCGGDNVRSLGDSPIILASAHRSWDDPAMIASTLLNATGSQVHFMAKKEIWEDSKLAGWFVGKTGAFPVDRENKGLNKETAKHIDNLVRNDGIIGIFPEGKRFSGETIDNDNLKRGIGYIALKYGLPVIPVGIAGSEEQDRGTMHVEYGRTLFIPRLPKISPKSAIGMIMDTIHHGMQEAQTLATEHRDSTLITRR